MIVFYIVYKYRSSKLVNLDKTSNLRQKFAALNILLYRKLLLAIAGFIQVQLFLPSLFIDNVKSDDLYVVWQTNDSNNTRLRSVGDRETITIDYSGYKRNRGYSNRSCTHPTSSKYTTESVKECYDNDTKV